LTAKFFKTSFWRALSVGGLTVVVMLLSGCVQMHQTIILNEDGSGKLIESFRFSDHLIQASKSYPDLGTWTVFLDGEQAKARLPLFWRGDVCKS